MAIHKLGDESYKNLNYDPKLWKGIPRENPSDLVGDMFPEIEKQTSLHENRSFCWFFGRIQIKGQGTVKIIYPYSAEYDEDFTVRNVDFSTFPFITLKAVPKPGWRFEVWRDAYTLEDIAFGPYLVISEFDFPGVTGFTALFRKDASNVGV